MNRKMSLTLLSFGLLTLSLTGCSQGGGSTGTSASTESQISPAQLQSMLPDTVGKGKPVVLDFGSRFCLDCQKISPKLDALQSKHPELAVMKVDIQKTTPSQKALMRALGITTVPNVEFITGTGQIKQVILGDATQSQVDADAAQILTPKA